MWAVTLRRSDLASLVLTLLRLIGRLAVSRTLIAAVKSALHACISARWVVNTFPERPSG